VLPLRWLARRAAAPSTAPTDFGEHAPRVAVVCMQKDEDELLPVWLAYYASVFAPQNLFIVDNGSRSAAIRAHLDMARTRGATVLNRAGHDNFLRKGRIVQEIAQANKGRYDAVIPVDCDEFIGLDVKKRPLCEAARIRQEIEGFVRSGCEVGTIRHQYVNIPGTTKVTRRKCNRVIITPGASFRLNRGFHFTDDIDGAHPTALTFLHFHLKASVEDMKRSARLKLPPEAVADPAAYTGGGYHMLRFLTMDEDAYRASFRKDGIDVAPVFAAIHHNVPFSRLAPR